MSSIRIYGKKGMIIAKPFMINSADDEPEAIAEETSIFNYSEENEETDTDKQS